MATPFTIACLWLSAAGVWAVDLRAVDPSLLDGSRLVAPEWNLSVSTPPGDWEWLAAPAGKGTGRNAYHALTCRSRETGAQFLVGVFDPYWRELTPDNTSRFVAGVVAGFTNSGWKAAVVESASVDIPLPKSYRFVVSAEHPNAGRRFVYGYLAARGRMFTFQHVSAEAAEPQSFRALVASYRFVGTAPTDPLDTIGRIHLEGTVALTLLVGGVGWIVNRLAGRIAVNAWNAAIVLLLVAGVVLAYQWVPRIPRDLSSFRQGEAFGAVVGGPITVPLLFALWRARALRRRRRREGGGGCAAPGQTGDGAGAHDGV
jgi:hypothetical protein